jgi:ribonuclease BN (tRNA processing enzyme)
MMEIRVLGCSGGIGGISRTTSFLVDRDIVVDAGTGLGDLEVADLIQIDHIFLTHSHLDHITLLPMLVDAGVGRRIAPMTAYGLPETIAALKECVFNYRLWPDYTSKPSPDAPYLRLVPIAVGETVTLGSRRISALPAKHAIPAAGYRIQGRLGSFVFSGDTTYCEEFWNALEAMDDLRYLAMETTFLNDNESGVRESGHTNATLLAKGLNKLSRTVDLFITHMEPGREVATMKEILAAVGEKRPQALFRGQVFQL